MKYLHLEIFLAFMLFALAPSALHAQNILEEQAKTPEVAISAREFLQRGKLNLEKMAYGAAIRNFNQAILLNPNMADSYYYRGLIRATLEDQLGAISDFDDAILRDPRHSWAYYHRAGVFFNLDNQAEGILDLQLAAQLFSEQGERTGYQQAVKLLNHYGVKSPVD